MNKNNNKLEIEVKNIEQSIERMLKRASGEQDQTVKRDCIYFLLVNLLFLIKFNTNNSNIYRCGIDHF